MLREALPPPPGQVVEVGSGAGFLDEVIADAIRSEVFWCPWIDVALDALALPFAGGSLRGVVMVNVLHHLRKPATFFVAAARCVRPGGVIVAVEPWNTPWSRLLYRKLHHEPFQPEATSWDLHEGGPLTGANGALPWILFRRDRDRFKRQLPQWSLRSVEPIMPFRYVIAGGISMRSLAPRSTATLWALCELALRPLRSQIAMFAVVTLVRNNES